MDKGEKGGKGVPWAHTEQTKQIRVYLVQITMCNIFRVHSVSICIHAGCADGAGKIHI